ncbi:MAG: methyl-accepting chemotaxis protein [Pseudanabaenaceae cyanobacterium]
MLTEDKPEVAQVSVDTTTTPNSVLGGSAKARGFFSSIRNKAATIGVGVSFLFVTITASTVYFLVSAEQEELVLRNQAENLKRDVAKFNLFLNEREGDIFAGTRLSMFRFENIFKALSPQQKNSSFQDLVDSSQDAFLSFQFIDRDGNTQFYSQGVPVRNHGNEPYFKLALNQNQQTIVEVKIAPTQSLPQIYFARAIRNWNQEIIGVILAELNTKQAKALLDEIQGTSAREYLVVDKNNQVLFASKDEWVGKGLPEVIPNWQDFQKRKTIDVKLAGKDAIASIETIAEGRLDWQSISIQAEEVVYAGLYRLRGFFILGSIFVILGTSGVVVYLINRGIKPLLEATKAVQAIGEGKLDTRLPVTIDDELGLLGENINSLAQRLKQLLEEQKQEAERLEKARQQARMEAEALARQQQAEKEKIQRRALELLMEVDPVSRGDLTVKARVTEDEIGTLADSYNSLIRSLRQIVSEVQSAAEAVNKTASAQEVAVSTVAENASKQVEAVMQALSQIESIAESLQGVAERAKQAEQQVRQTNQVVEAGDDAMNRTVASIATIRETVAETAKKVKRLGEASQKISKVVNLISDFADQTNLLALNAAIEAARAGEEGRGFAVVAEEVRLLAQQSAQATAEIEELVQEIQTQTNQVVSAMEEGTEQVVKGTQLVEESREKLSQIAQASAEVNRLVQEIAQSAIAQTRTSELVSQTMLSVANTVKETAAESQQASESFKELLAVAKELQVSVAQFKL